jgi:PPOX class probable F420-dependent enzyme
MARLPAKVQQFIASGPLAHVVTLSADGAPQISLAWVGIEDGEVVIGTMFDQAKLRNLRRDPRVSVSFAAPGRTELGLDHYLVLHGRARVTEGGAPELLGRLARTYLGPDVIFPGMPNPPGGWVIRIDVERLAGIGDWT